MSNVQRECNLGLSWLPANFKTLESFDAQHWAASFLDTLRNNPGIVIDHDLMVTWFASALMRGFDEHYQRTSEYKRLMRCVLNPWWSWRRYWPTAQAEEPK
jgi:hypothetical protein